MKNIYLISLGCPRNLLDSEVLIGLLKKSGFNLVETAEEADAAIVNTCGFIEEAKKESIDIILRLAELKRTGQIKRLVVSGCLSQRYPGDLTNEIREIDGIFGSSDFVKIPELMKKLTGEGQTKEVSEKPGFLYDHTHDRTLLTLSHYAYVKIQEGCSNRCTYCVIPDIRGPRRSRKIGSVMKEIEILNKKYDIKEAVIIGQDITSFGLDRFEENELALLLEKISPMMKDKWIRLLYTHPEKFTDELIEKIAHTENICKYIDLPIQHINNRILNKMNRKVSKDEIKALIKKLRSEIKDITLRTSIIVGFPGETEEEFDELMDFLKETRFDRLGAFIYSREEGTPAYDFEGQVPVEIKEKRFDRVMRLQQEISSENNFNMIGKTVKVLIDEKSEEEEDRFIGRSQMDAPEVDGSVFVKGKDLKVGSFVQVRITGAMEYDLVGEII
ncbi:MAG: 30S ribosomal protein S12 methylthiotransferase RimO [Candidatus Omnitrophota bacterium]